jgi:hypothetical protein
MPTELLDSLLCDLDRLLKECNAHLQDNPRCSKNKEICTLYARILVLRDKVLEVQSVCNGGYKRN